MTYWWLVGVHLGLISQVRCFKHVLDCVHAESVHALVQPEANDILHAVVKIKSVAVYCSQQ